MSILYWGQDGDVFESALSTLTTEDSAPPLVCVRTALSALSAELASLGPQLRLVVLAPMSPDELRQLLPLAPLLVGTPVIVHLKSGDCATVELAHRLHPRFVSFADEPMINSAAVALKIWKSRESLPGSAADVQIRKTNGPRD